MKGIKTKMVTDEEKVRMHTNFAEFKNVSVGMASPDIATFSIEDGVVKVHTNTIRDWGVYVHCGIPKSLLKAGQKYGISIRANRWDDNMGINIQNVTSTNRSREIVRTQWDGKRVSTVSILTEENLVNGLGIHTFLGANNTDYEFRDFRIWEIDDLGGAIVSILFIMLATILRREVAA